MSQQGQAPDSAPRVDAGSRLARTVGSALTHPDGSKFVKVGRQWYRNSGPFAGLEVTSFAMMDRLNELLAKSNVPNG